LSSIAKAKGHERKFKKAKRSSNGCLLNIIWVDWDLVICPYEIDFGKGSAASKTVGVVLYVWHWVPVRNGTSVESTIISAWSPTGVLLGYKM
jgi:hypothetical protein